MLALIIILSLFIIMAIASILWGKDSRDTIDSDEWERRRSFYDDSMHHA
jgi:hypothetical protein